MVGLTGGETIFSETVRGHGGIAHGLVRIRLDGRRVGTTLLGLH